MDPLKDQKYLYIAEEALISPLPENWKACQNREGQIYYQNFETGEQILENPGDLMFRMKFMQAKQADLRSSQFANQFGQL